VNGDRTRLTLDDHALVSQLVQALPLHLDRREHRRHLLDLTSETCQGRLDARLVEQPDLARLDNLAFGVAGGGRHSEPERRLVALVRVEEITGNLGRLTEADRQEAAGEPVQAPCVPGLACTVQALDALEHLVGAHLDRLVEKQDAVDGPSLVSASGQRSQSSSSALSPPSGGRTESIRSETRVACSRVVSCTKRSPGMYRIRRRSHRSAP
jgi:hypothetical protein